MTVDVPRLDFADAAGRLEAGGVLLLATDTLPGLHCRCDAPEAVARIQALKGREADKALLVLAGSLAQAQSLCAPLGPAQVAACEEHWPGPFTLILPAGRTAAAALSGGRGTIAVRVPDVPELGRLIEKVGVPLVSTSANRAGEPPAGDLAAAAAEFGAQVDGIWSSDQPATGVGQASALVDLTVEPFAVLRDGPRPFRTA